MSSALSTKSDSASKLVRSVIVSTSAFLLTLFFTGVSIAVALVVYGSTLKGGVAMHNLAWQKPLGAFFFSPEVQAIAEYLDRGFSPTVQVAIVCLCMYARGQGSKPLADILAVLEKPLRGGWRIYEADFKPIPAVPDGLGVEDHFALDDICEHLGIPSPYKEGRNAPKRQLAVKTFGDHIYRFGEEDGDNKRTVTINGSASSCPCKIAFLAIGMPMELIWHGSPTTKSSYTPIVISVGD